MFEKILIGMLFLLPLIAAQTSGAAAARLEKATFAGGCFWCMESPFEKLDGVKEVISGYTGGHKVNPMYEEVSAGSTGHVESVEVIFDPSKVTYEKLLDVFWRQINPIDAGGQFVDRGPSYTSAIFYHNEEQKKPAEQSKRSLNNRGVLISRSSPRYVLPGLFTGPRDITRTTGRRTRSDTNFTATIQGATSI